MHSCVAWGWIPFFIVWGWVLAFCTYKAGYCFGQSKVYKEWLEWEERQGER